MKWLFAPTLFVTAWLFLSLPLSQAKPTHQFTNEIEQGEYIATVGGCSACHTDQTEGSIPYAGGRAFNIGPLGTVYAKNLTPDNETGIGNWTKEAFRTAMQTGVSPDGLHLYPIMPIYPDMADSDLDALFAYLQSLEPVPNSIDRSQILPVNSYDITPVTEEITAPETDNIEARGIYLVEHVLRCGDCHTSIDPTTGNPIPEEYLAGRQPFEGEWGVIYAGNITPHPEFGIGNWSDADIERLLRTGVRPDGRNVVVMRWQRFPILTDEDLTAVIHYLRNNVEPKAVEVPAPALTDEYITYAENDIKTTPAQSSTNSGTWVAIVVTIALLASGIIFLIRRGKN